MKKRQFNYVEFRREYARLRRMSVYERINAAAEAQTERRRRSATRWWQSRAMWYDDELAHSPTEADAFQHVMSDCPYHPGDPMTEAERREETHFAVTVARAVLGEMRLLPHPKPKRRSADHAGKPLDARTDDLKGRKR